ncbi:MAG: oxidoreductase [Opitutae bacterium]|nr:oxidoreductase [Opitutae bacterium]
MKQSTSRRTFLGQAGAGLSFPFVAKTSWAQKPPSETVRHVSFGGGGMAGADVGAISSHPKVTVAAVVEIDPGRRKQIQQRFRNAKVYADWREMLDKEGNNLDTANVSVPDHMHAPMAMSAMLNGIHVYCQKPLTHDVYESRILAKYAKKRGLATQMGIQIHSNSEYRTAVKLVHDGVIGKVKEAHSFSNKRWGDSNPKPNRKDPIPDGLNWENWIGPAPYTDYIKGYYHPGQWRKRLDYGTGTFGDMGCHIYDPVFKALGLTYPISLKSTGPKPNKDNWGFDAKIHYTFPNTPYSADKTLPVTWYDGGAHPPKHVQALLEGKGLPGQGSIVIGTKGTMLIPHVGYPQLFPKKDFADFQIEKVPKVNHWHSFIEAARGEGKASANFDYSGPLSETVLLGGVATRFPGETLKWEAEDLAFADNEKATSLIRKTYRQGWEVEGL